MKRKICTFDTDTFFSLSSFPPIWLQLQRTKYSILVLKIYFWSSVGNKSPGHTLRNSKKRRVFFNATKLIFPWPEVVKRCPESGKRRSQRAFVYRIYFQLFLTRDGWRTFLVPIPSHTLPVKHCSQSICSCPSPLTTSGWNELSPAFLRQPHSQWPPVVHSAQSLL